ANRRAISCRSSRSVGCARAKAESPRPASWTMSFRTKVTSIRFGLVSCRACALSITTARRKSSSSAAMTLRLVRMDGRWIQGIRCTGGKMGLFGPAQKTLLELLQEAVPVSYVLILQIFELRQECSRLEGVVTASFQFRKPFTLLP